MIESTIMDLRDTTRKIISHLLGGLDTPREKRAGLLDHQKLQGTK